MTSGIVAYLRYWRRMVAYAAAGGVYFYAWIASLITAIGLGAYGFSHHIIGGLGVTNMNDHVPWGIGIANFVFFVGVAAAAAILVVPAYVYKRKDVKQVVLVGELMAFCSVLMCMLFITTDVGRPERLWHLAPVLGELNLPSSLLAWDVLVFQGYLLLNLHIPGYLLYQRYRGREAKAIYYLPFVFVSIFWAVSIHTVTAFLLSGLGSRPFWNTAILAPRFLMSAAASGPAILFFVFTIIKKNSTLEVPETVFELLKTVLKVAMPVNLFLLFCEAFTEFYPGTLHAASAEYLFFGLGGYHMLPKFIWTAIVVNTCATIVFVTPRLRAKPRMMLIACGLTIAGIWTEKGMGLIFPGFTPSPLGEVQEYAPAASEIFVNVGVFGLGALLFTLLAKVSVGILSGELHLERQPTPWLEGKALWASERAEARSRFAEAMERAAERSLRRSNVRGLQPKMPKPVAVFPRKRLPKKWYPLGR
jgi:Ni/Fe-hydrogenase subunit HybB-like protein